MLCLVDDIFVYGKDSTEHKSRLQATFERIQAAGITLNESKINVVFTNLVYLF